MPKTLEGKVAVISGGSRGLGRAMAVALAGEGASIALVARDQGKLSDVAGEVRAAGGQAATFIADVTNETQVETARQGVLDKFGGVHILINNAGINIRKRLHEYSLDEWNRVLDTNLTSVFLMCRAFVPHMKGQGYGRIINLSSIMAHIALPGRGPYCASKAALLGLTRALALELATDGITVVGISPGPFATEMNTPLIQDPEINAQFISKIPVGRWGRVEEVGSLARFICSEEAAFITGTDILIDGGWCAQ